MIDYLDEDEATYDDGATVDYSNTEAIIEPGAVPVLGKRSAYKSIKDDQVDAAFAKVVNTLIFNLPFIRLGAVKYLIGTETKMIIIKNSTCMVRVGGGFERLEDYLARNHDSEMEKIKRMMND